MKNKVLYLITAKYEFYQGSKKIGALIRVVLCNLSRLLSVDKSQIEAKLNKFSQDSYQRGSKNMMTLIIYHTPIGG